MTNEEIRAIVLKHLHELVPDSANREVPPGAMLDALGADSLDLVDVASRAMQELEVKLPRAAIAHIRTLDDLVEALQAASVAKATEGTSPAAEA
jgi:acyl carrier protein